MGTLIFFNGRLHKKKNAWSLVDPMRYYYATTGIVFWTIVAAAQARFEGFDWLFQVLLYQIESGFELL
jgi:hypothetical protein